MLDKCAMSIKKNFPIHEISRNTLFPGTKTKLIILTQMFSSESQFSTWIPNKFNTTPNPYFLQISNKFENNDTFMGSERICAREVAK